MGIGYEDGGTGVGGMCMRVWEWGYGDGGGGMGGGSLASFPGLSQLYGPYHVHTCTMLIGMDHM